MRAELYPTYFASLRIYLNERFPLVSNGVLIAVLTASSVFYAAAQNSDVALPTVTEVLAGFVTVLLTFLIMRFLDEFKDAEDDARYRPYRPVPRGLISLKSIGLLTAGAVATQLAVQWIWLPDQFWLLGAIYGYLALMTVEFGAGGWLKRHPLTYAVSHMFIMPLIGLYAAGIARPDAGFPDGLSGSLLLLFFCGFVIEIGRKIRAPGDEEPGVDTYSGLYGPVRASVVWLGCVSASFAVVIWLLRDLPFALVLGGFASIGFGLCIVAGSRYARRADEPCARRIELVSGIWVLLVLASVAIGSVAYVILETSS